MAHDDEKVLTWTMRCSAVAGSGTYSLDGHPETQVAVLRAQLKAAAADGVDWRPIYAHIYDHWHSRRPLFPVPDTMAALIAQETASTEQTP